MGISTKGISPSRLARNRRIVGKEATRISLFSNRPKNHEHLPNYIAHVYSYQRLLAPPQYQGHLNWIEATCNCRTPINISQISVYITLFSFYKDPVYKDVSLRN